MTERDSFLSCFPYFAHLLSMCRCFLRRHCVIRTSSFCRTALACTAAPAMVGGATCFSDFALLLSASMRVQPLFCLCILKFRNTIQSHNDDIACCDQKGLVFSLASHTSRIFCTCVSAFRASALRNYVSHPKCLAYTRKKDWILSCIFGNWRHSSGPPGRARRLRSRDRNRK